VISLFQRGAASMGRLLDILDARSLLVGGEWRAEGGAIEEASAKREHSELALRPPPPALRPIPTTRSGRTIEFRNVGFHYPTAKGHHGQPRWVLRHRPAPPPAGAATW